MAAHGCPIDTHAGGGEPVPVSVAGDDVVVSSGDDDALDVSVDDDVVSADEDVDEVDDEAVAPPQAQTSAKSPSASHEERCMHAGYTTPPRSTRGKRRAALRCRASPRVRRLTD